MTTDETPAAPGETEPEPPSDTDAVAAGVEVVDVDELEVIRAENEDLRRQLAAQPPPKKAKPKSMANPWWRKAVVGLLVVLAVVAMVASVSVAWARTTIQDEDQFVKTLAPLPKQESVASVLAFLVAEGVVEAKDVEGWVSGNLPNGLKFLAIPVTDSITTVIAGVANQVIVSDAFESVWSGALRVTHKAATVVMDGNDRALESEDGAISINLDEIGSLVVEKVEATGLELPDNEPALGSITIYRSGQLAAVQSLVRTIDTLGWFLPLLSIVFIALAIWLSRDRRRTMSWLGFGTAIGLVLSLIGLRYGRNFVVNAIEDVTKQQAVGEAWDLVLNRLIQMMWAALILALIVGIIAWVMGPSPRSTQTRAWVTGTIQRWRQPAEDRPNFITNFIADWKPTIEVVAVVIGLGVILFGPPPTGFSVLLTAVIVFAIIVVTEVLAAPKPAAIDSVEVVDVVEVDEVVEETVAPS